MKYITKSITRDFTQKYLIETGTNCAFKFNFYHKKPGLRSRIQILIIASSKAKVRADATITITPTAPRSDAWLEIHVITRDHATVETAPNLEINNDAVKAGHALSTKYISEDELFYLMSRGLSRTSAENLMLDGIAAPYRKEGIKLNES